MSSSPGSTKKLTGTDLFPVLRRRDPTQKTEEELIKAGALDADESDADEITTATHDINNSISSQTVKKKIPSSCNNETSFQKEKANIERESPQELYKKAQRLACIRTEAERRERKFRTIIAILIAIWAILVALWSQYIEYRSYDSLLTNILSALDQTWIAVGCVIRQGSSFLSTDWHSFHCAAQHGNLLLLKMAFAMGFNMDVRGGSNGSTPLHVACVLQKYKVVRWLVKHGNADIDIADGEGRQAIHWATAGSDTRILNFLLQQEECDVDARTKRDTTPLHIASEMASEIAVKWLLNHDANPMVFDNLGWTPLHYAAQANNTRIVRLLSEKGGESLVNAQTKQGYTPLHIAAYHKSKAAMEYLLDCDDVDPSITDIHGHTPLYYSTVLKRDTESIEKLLEEGVELKEIFTDPNVVEVNEKAAKMIPGDSEF